MSVKKMAKISFILLFFLCLIVPEILAANTIKMRIMLVNPSTSKAQTKSVKNYLPKEIVLKNVLDNGGLEVDYDEAQGLLYVYKNDVELSPSEVKTFEVVLEDVWVIAKDQLDGYRNRAAAASDRLKNTPYFNQADLLVKAIWGRLDTIEKNQNDPNVSKQQKIAYYRDHMKVIDQIKDDIEKLEKFLVAVGGPPNIELIEQSDINLKSPSSKTTWIVIFIVLIFIGILSATFYFTWMRQASLTENIFTKEKGDSFSEFKPPSPGPKLDEPEKKP